MQLSFWWKLRIWLIFITLIFTQSFTFENRLTYLGLNWSSAHLHQSTNMRKINLAKTRHTFVRIRKRVAIKLLGVENNSQSDIQGIKPSARYNHLSVGNCEFG